MLFEWTEEKIEWYIRASRITGFHRILADRIRPSLKVTDHVVDLGCGPGLIDLEISRDVGRVTAIDIDQLVLRRLGLEIKKGGYSNIHTVQGDVKETPGAMLPGSFDILLTCFFGGPGPVFEAAYRKASRMAIFITHGADTSKNPSKIGGEFRRVFADEMDAWLDAKRIQFIKIDDCLDFGQPFLSTEEAERFFEVYAKEYEDPKERRAHIEDRLALVEETDDPAYPRFFHNLKDVAIFIIEK